ncbi:hypothetical protein BC629DRAFT_1441884 [Irpex lacteus]|nr:hypothetical protein BC629DRAFT_1441884 [Irpex lacteus]
MAEVNVNVPLDKPAPVCLNITHGNINVAVNVKISGGQTELQFHVDDSVKDIVMAEPEPEDNEVNPSAAVLHNVNPETREITTQVHDGRLSRPSRAAALEQTGIPTQPCSRPLRKAERPVHSRDQLQGTAWPAKPAILQLEQLRTRLAEFPAARPLRCASKPGHSRLLAGVISPAKPATSASRLVKPRERSERRSEHTQYYLCNDVPLWISRTNRAYALSDGHACSPRRASRLQREWYVSAVSVRTCSDSSTIERTQRVTARDHVFWSLDGARASESDGTSDLSTASSLGLGIDVIGGRRDVAR